MRTRHKYLKRFLHLFLVLCLVAGATMSDLSAWKLTVEAAESDDIENANIIYVDGVARDNADGKTAETAFETLYAALDAVPDDNSVAYIVVCGEVNIFNGTLQSQQTTDHYYLAPHAGKVIITSVLGEEGQAGYENHKDVGKITVDKYKYINFLGETVFQDIVFSGKVYGYLANYFPLHFSTGIELSGITSIAKFIWPGSCNAAKKVGDTEINYVSNGTITAKDMKLTIDSGVFDDVYGVSTQYQPATIKDKSVEITVNGGTITNLCGSGLKTSNVQSTNITVNVNGGDITNLYGASVVAKISGDIKININGGTVGTLVGASSTFGQKTDGSLAAPEVTGNLEVVLNGGNVTTLKTVDGTNTIGGEEILHLIGSNQEGTSATVTLPSAEGFTTLKLTDCSLNLPGEMATQWTSFTKIALTDNSLLELGFTPTEPSTKISVTVAASGEQLQTGSALIKAPAGTADIFQLTEPLNYKLTYNNADNASWTLDEAGVSIGEAGTAGTALDLDLGLPDGTYTPIDADADAYEVFEQKLEDLGDASKEVKVISPITVQGEVELHVSPSGNDNNKGSVDAPFYTIAKALEYVEALENLGVQGVVIYLHAGTYVASESITLNATHSGKHGIPVIISSYADEEVVVTGGTDIAGSSFAKVTDEAILNRLNASVRDQIMVVDLKALGISEFGSIVDGRYGGPAYSLTMNNEVLTLARYPDATYLPLGEVLDPGPVTNTANGYPVNDTSTGVEYVMQDLRPTLWQDDENIWLYGNIGAEWEYRHKQVAEIREESKSVKLVGGVIRGAISKPGHRYYYYNVLEELNVPGEYYVDHSAGKLYLYPIGDMSTATITYTATSDDIFSFNGASNIVLNGLTIENSGGCGIRIDGCENILAQNCVIRNVGTGAIIYGKNCGIIYSEICDTQKNPVEIGEAVSTHKYNEPEHNFVQNCYIYNTGMTCTSETRILLQGTQNVVSHNLIQGTYAVSIYLFYARECIAEYNEIVGGPNGTYDYGSIYHSPTGGSTGNHIRYNYIHDTARHSSESNPHSIYLDEGARGNFVYGNVMNNVQSGIYLHFGSQNVVKDNVVMSNREGRGRGIYGNDTCGDYTIAKRWARDGYTKAMYDRWAAFNDTEKAEFKGRYPGYARLYEAIQTALADAGGSTDTGVGLYMAEGNYAVNNVLVGFDAPEYLGKTDHVIKDNAVLTEDPFTDAANHNFALKEGTTLGITYTTPDMSRIGVLGNKDNIGEVSLYAPSNGFAEVDPYKVLLKWTLAGGADTYKVTVAKNADLTEAPQEFVVEDTYLYFERDEYFEFNKTYYWKVEANSTAESRVTTAVTSTVSSFTTMTEEKYLEYNKANLDELTQTIADAEALLTSMVEVAEGGLYYAGSKAELQTAIDAAKAILNIGVSQDQADVNAAVSELEKGIAKAKASREIQYITFAELNAEQWTDIANKRVSAAVVEDELQLSIASGSRAEAVYSEGLGIRDILCFKYKLDEMLKWNGFALAQTDASKFITEGTDGYFICINPTQVELQKYQGGSKVVQINVPIDANVFTGGEFYDMEVGAINNPDGTVGIHFKINGTVIFDPAVHLDTETDEAIPGSPIIGATGFGVIVNPDNKTAEGNNTTHLMKAELGEDEEPADGYTAGLNTLTSEVTVGDTVNVNVAVAHSEATETEFAAGEVVITYDSSKLTFDEEAFASGLGTAEVEVTEADNVGTLTLEDFGANKSFGNNVYTLTFKAVADGNATVTMTSAAFIDTESSSTENLIKATISPANVTLTVNKVAHDVTLPEGFDGDATVTDGEDYTFSVSAEDGAYYDYDEVTATVDGGSVTVTNNGDGTYTIEEVTGELVITGNRTAKSFGVKLDGTAAAEITDAADQATYGTDYTFTMPTADGFAYNLASLKIGGVESTDYKVDAETNVVTISGSAIKGQIEITINKTATKAAVTVNGSGASAAAGYNPSAEIGKDYVLTITPEIGWTYTVTATMNGTSVEVIEDSENNTYTVKSVTGPIVFTVERKIELEEVEVTHYLTIDANNVWLVKNTTNVDDGKVPTYDGNNMFWSEKYNAYCYLVIAETIPAEEVTSKVGIADGTAISVDYGMDVNMSGKVDASDAQLTYNIYNAMYSEFTADVTMEKFLRADVNADEVVNVEDAASIITYILGNN